MLAIPWTKLIAGSIIAGLFFGLASGTGEFAANEALTYIQVQR